MYDQKNPLISVVILAGPNRKKELYRNIRSIKLSTYRHFEIVVVDNSGTRELSEDIRKDHPDITVIDMTINSGIYGFNVGFANAKGRYILGIDDDCAVRKDTLEQIKETFAHASKSVAVISCNIFNPLYNEYCEKSKIDKNITWLYSFADGAVVFKREIFEKVGYYDENFFFMGHSDDLAIRILKAGYKIYFGKNIWIDHYQKTKTFRNKSVAFLTFRNAAWFNLKHFSLRYLPILLVRNSISFILLPFKQKSLIASLYGLTGYMSGWLTFYIAWKKREVAPQKIQKNFIIYYLTTKFPEEIEK